MYIMFTFFGTFYIYIYIYIYIYNVCVFLLCNPVCKLNAPYYIIICVLSVCTKFVSHYLIYGTILRGRKTY